jgi:hypothetical protein
MQIAAHERGQTRISAQCVPARIQAQPYHDPAANLKAAMSPSACRLAGQPEIFCSVNALPLN